MKGLHIQVSGTISAIILLIWAVVFGYESMKSILSASPRSYGQGYLPFFSSVSLFVFALLFLREAMNSKFVEEVDNRKWRKLIRGPGLTFLSTVAYMGLMELVGFGVATFLLLLGLLRTLKTYPWVTALVVSVIYAICFHYIFADWLSIPLPKGGIFKYLPSF